jgi:hypothetical protein
MLSKKICHLFGRNTQLSKFTLRCLSTVRCLLYSKKIVLSSSIVTI